MEEDKMNCDKANPDHDESVEKVEFATKEKKTKKKDTNVTNKSSQQRGKKSSSISILLKEKHQTLITSLQLLDPLIQFLTKASGRTSVSLTTLRSITPSDKRHVIQDIPELCRHRVLHCEKDGVHHNEVIEHLEHLFSTNNSDDIAEKSKLIMIGFPPPMNHFVGSLDGKINGEDPSDAKKGNAKQSLHGSTKSAGKRRLAALKKILKDLEKSSKDKHTSRDASSEGPEKVEEPSVPSKIDRSLDSVCALVEPPIISRGLKPDMLDGMVHDKKYDGYTVKEQHNTLKECTQSCFDTDKSSDSMISDTIEGEALASLIKMLDNQDETKELMKNDNEVAVEKDQSIIKKSFVLQKQASYAGSIPERKQRFSFLSYEKVESIPDSLIDAMGLKLFENDGESYNNSANVNSRRRTLYFHQAKAIESTLNGDHTFICTGTGSGKSLCFLLPILATVMKSDMSAFHGESQNLNSGISAIIMFPTKALAQDQLSKLHALVKNYPLLEKHIRVGIIDGDTPHLNRTDTMQRCNIILTNPDTLHAAILPGWKGIYRGFLARLKYVVIDELHTYNGAFGAHVSLVLSRLLRICLVAKYTNSVQNLDIGKILFIACSATIGHPENHFRLLCPVASEEKVTIVQATEDGSPCAAKHFFVWNPSLVDSSGNCIDRVTIAPGKNCAAMETKKGVKWGRRSVYKKRKIMDNMTRSVDATNDMTGLVQRTHAADETARILARLVKNRVRCIAFCKTRSLAEWVYERCVNILRSEESSKDLSSLVEIYRGGYTASIRRGIEARLFKNEILGVVGTSALELGVDIGGIHVTLHCGYPGNINSLLQQAGRAGRGATSTGPSFSIMVSFSSPSEQHLWKHPKGLLGRGLSPPPAVPLNSGIISGHLLCASAEWPLMGHTSVISILNVDPLDPSITQLCDFDLFGSEAIYTDALENILERGHIRSEKINITSSQKVETFSIHPSIEKPWSRVSLRSIEPINYSIVDLSHPKQVGVDNVICEDAVLDRIPYSRVFYHAYPGAIIMHRGRRYKIHSMSSPPPFADSTVGYRFNACNLGAFAKPSSDRYSTRALSITLITIVKQLYRVKLPLDFASEGADISKDHDSCHASQEFVPVLTTGHLAGHGVVTVKRTVHGYTKLSLVNRSELSRTEITLPPMEYDTNALFIDTEASVLAELIPDYDKGFMHYRMLLLQLLLFLFLVIQVTWTVIILIMVASISYCSTLELVVLALVLDCGTSFFILMVFSKQPSICFRNVL